MTDILDDIDENDPGVLKYRARAKANRDAALSLSAQVARETTPEEVARIRALSKQTGIPESLVEAGVTDIEDAIAIEKYRAIGRSDPTLAAWLSNPENAKIARGDEDNLGLLGQTLKYMAGDASRKLSKLGGDIAQLGDAYSRSEEQTRQAEAGFDRLMGGDGKGGDERPSGYIGNLAAPDAAAPKPFAPAVNPYAGGAHFLTGGPGAPPATDGVVMPPAVSGFASTKRAGFVEKSTAFDVEGSYLPGWAYTIAENLDPTVEVFQSGVKGALVTGGAGALAIGGGVGLLTGGAAALPAAVSGFTSAAPAGFTAGALLKSFQLEAGSAYQEFSQIQAESGERLDPDIARGAAVLAGSINAGLEVISLRYIVDKIPGLKALVSKGGTEVAKQAMATPTARSLLARLGKTVAMTSSVGGLTEAAQEIVPIVLGEMAKSLDDDEFKSAGMFEDQYDADGNVVSQAIVPRVVHSAQIGTLLGGFFGGIGGGVQAGIDFRAMGKPARDAEKKAKADALRKQLDEAGKQVDATKLSKLDRDALRDIIKKQAEGGRENIFFQSSDWDDAFTSAGIDPAVAYQSIMGDAAGYREAKTLDGLLTIPIERFLADTPPDIRTALAGKALESEDGLTVVEGERLDAAIEEANKNALAALEEYKDARADTAREHIKSDILGQLIGTYARDVAETQAEIQAEKFIVFAERNGLDPEEYYKQRAPEVRQAIAARIRADIDTQLDPLLDALASNEIPSEADAYGETLTQWLRRKGGIREDGGELAARDTVEYDKDTRKPGENSLVTEDGLTLDEAARMAMDEGFLAGTFENTEATPDRLLEALEEEMRGTPVYSPQNENSRLAERRERLLALDDILLRAGIDPKTANREAVKGLIRGQVLEQSAPAGVGPASQIDEGNVNEREATALPGGQYPAPGVRETDEPDSGQLSLFLPPAADKRQAYADLYGTVIKARTVAHLKAGLDSVKAPEDVAHLLASIRKYAQEALYAVVTDKSDKVLRVILHTRGLNAESSASPLTLIAEAASIPGAARMHLAHNHPSGDPTPSAADIDLTNKIRSLMDGTGISLGHHVVVAGKAWGNVDAPGRATLIEAAARTVSVPVTERAITKRGTLGDRIVSPAAAARVTAGHRDAVFLLSVRHDPVGIVPLTADEMKTLRIGGRVNRLLSAINTTNASAVIVKTDDRGAATNVIKFLNRFGRGDLRVLDWIGPGGVSMASSESPADAAVIDATGPFFSRADPVFHGTAAEAAAAEPDGFMRLFHNGNEGVTEIRDDGVFGGLFAKRGNHSSGLGGNEVYFMDVAEDSVLTNYALNYEVDHDSVAGALRNAAPWIRDDSDFDLAWTAVIEDKAHNLDLDDLLRVMREDDAGAASWEAQRLRGKVARSLGYQAVEMSDESGASYLVLPGAKAVRVIPAGERMAADATGPFFSRRSGQDADLIIQHNLTAENALHAARMGGLAVPSLAVTRVSQPLTNFGEITLLGNSDLADPRQGTQVFGADIYSPRYPEIHYKLDTAARKRLDAILEPYTDSPFGRIGTVKKVDDLTNHEAFNRYADAKAGKKATYPDRVAEAKSLLQAVGAEERLFKGFTNAGNRRYIPHTLENVVRELKKDLRGGERFGPSVANLRARVTPKFRSLDQMRNEKRRLVSEADFEIAKKQVSSDFLALVERAISESGRKDMRAFDAVAGALEDSLKMNLGRALTENALDNISPELKGDMRAFMAGLRDLPTEYFEATKPRAVGLSEFRVAVVPKDVNAKARQVLERAGLKIVEYEKGEANRVRAIAQASRDEGVLFSRSQTPDTIAHPTNEANREETQKLEASLKKQGNEFTVTPVSVPVDSADGARGGQPDRRAGPQNHFALAEQLASLFGKRIVWVTADGPFQINGVVVPGRALGGVIFIDVRADMPAHVVLGHELSHHLEADNPAVYAKLLAAVTKLLKNHAQYRRKSGIGADMSDKALAKEMLGDLMGDSFADPEFWGLVAKENPSVFRRIADAIVGWLNDVIARFTGKGLGSESYVTDLKAARLAIAEAVAQYALGGKVAKRSAPNALYAQAYQSGDEWYSQLRAVLERKLPNSGTAESMWEMIDSYKDFKADELKYSGLKEWLAGQTGKVTKRDILDQLDLNAVQVEAVVLGDELDAASARDLFDEDWPHNFSSWLHEANKIEIGKAWEDEDHELWSYMPKEKEGYLDDHTDEDGAVDEGAARDDYEDDASRLDPSDYYTAEEWGDLEEQAWHSFGGIYEGRAMDAREEAAREAESRGGSPTKFEQWQLPGPKTNYREVLLTLPGDDDMAFRSSHFDEPNIVAHLRLNDRIDADGRRVLFVEEVQSDWHQHGRKRGYFSGAKPWEVFGPDGVAVAVFATEAEARTDARRRGPLFDHARGDQGRQQNAVPDAPFKQSWPMLAMKKALRLAVDGGYDALAWTTGEQQAERYDLSKQVDRIAITKTGGAWAVNAWKGGAKVITKDAPTDVDLAALVGKELAERAINDGGGEYSGLDLKVGGEGMRAFYDRMLPNEVNKYVKKWGGRVGEATINGRAQHSLPITDQIREGVSAGQPLFSRRPNVRPRASIQFPIAPGDRFIIDLSKADYSSFQHEMAHFWLEEVARAAKMADANPGIVDDHATILGWFGKNAGEIMDWMKSSADPKGPITPEAVAEVEARGGVEYIRQRAAMGATALDGDIAESAVARSLHEYWARGSEAYLYEGKAPSLAMRDAFSRFWGWMRQVYSNIKHLRVTLSDDIRGVMDRLTATADEIAAASAAQSRKPLFDNPEEYGTPEEWDAYQKQVERAGEQATSEVTIQMMAPLKRAQEAWYRARREEVRAAVEVEVKSRQDYKAQRYLRTGLHEDIDAKPMKMSKASLMRAYPAAYLKRLTGMYSSTGGVDYDFIAGILGYKTGDELVLALVNAPQNQSAWGDMIDAETQARLVEQYGDPMTDGTLAAKAMQAVHNDGQAAVLILEARKLAAKAGKPPDETPYQIIKRAAKGAIERQTNKDINPNKYRVAEAKAGKKAFEAAAAGKFAEALTAKQQELWAHEMYRAASDAKESLSDIQVNLRSLTKKAAQDRFAKAGKQYLQAVNFLLGSYGVGPKRLDENGDMKGFLESLAARGEAVQVTDEMLARVASENVVSLKDITYSEALDLRDAMTNLAVLARRELQASSNRKKVEWQELRDTLVAKLRTTLKPGKPFLSPSDRRGVDRLKNTYKGFADILENAQSLVEIMDGGREGPWHDAFWSQASDARDAQSELSAKVLKPIMDAIDAGGSRRWLDPIRLKTLGLETRRSTLIAIALNLGTNTEKLMRGGTVINGNHVAFSPAVIEEVKSHLTREDWDMVQLIWRSVANLWQPTVDLQERLGLRVPERIAGVVISTPFGDIQGEYFPLFADSEKSAVGQELEAKQSAQAIAGNISRPSTSKSRLKERTGAIYPLNLHLENVLGKALGDVITDIAQREFLLQANRILGDTTVMNLIRERMGGTAYESLKAMVNRAVNERQSFDPAMTHPNKLMESVVLNLTTMALGLRVLLGAANYVTGLIQSLPDIGAGYLVGGIKRHAAAPQEATAFIHDLSPYMKHRMGHADYLFAEAIKKLAGKQTLRAKMIRASMAYLVTTDHLVTKPVWLAVFHREMDGYAKNGGEGHIPTAEERERAVRLADKAVQQTQSDPTATGISAFEASPHWRLFKLFIGPMLIQQRKFRHAIAKKGASYDSSWPERFGVILATWVVPSMLFDVIMGRGPDLGDDDDNLERSSLWAAVKIGLYPAMTIPGVRDLAALVERKMLGKPYMGRANPIQDAGNVLIDSMANIADSVLDATDGDEEMDAAQLVDSMGKAAGVFGFPYTAIKPAGSFVYDVATGEYEPAGPQDLRFLFIKREEE